MRYSCRALDAEGPAFKTTDDSSPKIPLKPRKTPTSPSQPNGNRAQNGLGTSAKDTGAHPQGVKRSYPGEDSQPTKKLKTTAIEVPTGSGGDDDGIVLIEDAGGAIVIDDD
jgi:hypothetical protein